MALGFSWIFKVGAGVVGILGASIVALYLFQEKLLYVPIIPGVSPDEWIEADRFGLVDENIEIETKDKVKIHGWLLKLSSWTDEFVKSRPVVLFFQENAGNMSYRLPFLAAMIKTLKVPVLAVSYRGYGKSKGKPNERGLRLDAEAGLAHLLQRSDINSNRIIVFGRSLGGAVAIYLASKHQDKIEAMILENTFTSVEEMVGQVLGPLGQVIGRGKPLNFLVTNKWPSRKTIPSITKPKMLMLVSGKDEMVPPSQMHDLYKAQRAASCKLVEFPDAHHMDAYDQSPTAYWGALLEFVQFLSAKKLGSS